MGDQKEEGVVEGKSREFSSGIFVVVMLVFVLLVWRTSILPFQASRLSIKANSYFSVAPAQALEFAQEASAISTPYLDEQTFLISRNLITIASSGQFDKLPKAGEWASLVQGLTEQELARHPRNTHPWFIGGRLSHELALTKKPEYAGQIAVAEKRYREAIALSPKRQQLHQSLARLLLQTGRLDEALETLKNVRDFDTELGEGYWMYGLSLAFDKKDVVEGSKQMVKAFDVQFPYAIQDPKELGPYAEAVFTVNDPATYKRFLEVLEVSPKGTDGLYAQIAVRLEAAGQAELLPRIFAIQPGVQAAYTKLKAAK